MKRSSRKSTLKNTEREETVFKKSDSNGARRKDIRGHFGIQSYIVHPSRHDSPMWNAQQNDGSKKWQQKKQVSHND